MPKTNGIIYDTQNSTFTYHSNINSLVDNILILILIFHIYNTHLVIFYSQWPSDPTTRTRQKHLQNPRCRPPITTAAPLFQQHHPTLSTLPSGNCRCGKFNADLFFNKIKHILAHIFARKFMSTTQHSIFWSIGNSLIINRLAMGGEFVSRIFLR